LFIFFYAVTMKKTKLLQQVLAIFSEAGRPLSVPDIQNLLGQQGAHPNKTTLYRMLEKLTENGQTETLLLDPKITHYELKTHHHPHFTCQNCDRVQCISDKKLEKNINTLVKKLKTQGLTISQNHFSLTGTCNTCQ